ncbi:MAG: tyrosine-type recombinase/integrase [bacterium]
MGEYLKTRYPGIFQYVGPNGTVYGIDYYAGGKKHREIVGPLLGEARKKLDERRDQAKDGITIQKKNTFRKLAQEYAKFDCETPSYKRSQKYYIGYWERSGDGTLLWKDMTLTEFFGDKKLYQITPHAIEEFKKLRKDTPAHRVKERSDASVNRELAVLRRMLNKAIEWRWLEKNPFAVFHESVFYGEDYSRARFLSPDEMVRLFDALEESPPYLEPIVKAAILTGLRKGDLLKLQWKEIDLARGFFTYLEQKKSTSRGAEAKTVVQYMSQDLIDLLAAVPRAGDYVFCGPRGKRLKDVSQAFKRALKRAGITDFHFHDLRHTSASYLLMRGATLAAVQKHLHHKDSKMTQRYAHLAEQFQRDAVRKLDGLFAEVQNNSKNLVRSGPDENVTA